MNRSLTAFALFFSVMLGGVSAPQAALAQGAEQVVLQPSSRWHASYEDGVCRLARMFEAQNSTHALIFEQTGPSSNFNLTLTGEEFSEFSQNREVRLGFGSDDLVGDHDIVMEESSEFGQMVFLKDVGLKEIDSSTNATQADPGLTALGRSIDPETAQNALSVTIAQRDKSLTFDTGPLAQPFQVLNECSLHILSTWGLDVAKHKELQRGVSMLRPNRIARNVSNTYPQLALQEGRTGVVGLTLLVDELGQPTECMITHDSGHADLNQAACRGLMEGAYEPALDADGVPIGSFFVTRVIYRLG